MDYAQIAIKRARKKKMNSLSIDDINNLQTRNEELIRENERLKIALKEIKEIAKNNLELGIIIPGGWLEQKIDEVLNDKRKNNRKQRRTA